MQIRFQNTTMCCVINFVIEKRMQIILMILPRKFYALYSNLNKLLLKQSQQIIPIFSQF